MKLFRELKTSVLLTLAFAFLLGGLYPLAVWGAGKLLFPRQAEGSLLHDRQGNVIGSALLGQNFNAPQYFHPRPSAAGNAGYDGTASGGSNYGPTSQKLVDAVRQRVADYRKENGLPADGLVPADAVTASASGLDPHISLKNALLQLPRVAARRGLSPEDLRAVLDHHIDRPFLGFVGEAGVNVVTLNLVLDGKIE